MSAVLAAGGSGSTSPRLGRALLGLLPAVLAALAEGAWVAVVAALVAAAAHETAPFVVPAAAVAALAGFAAARNLGRRPDWPALAMWLTFGAAAVGWIADGSPVTPLARLDLPAALGSHAAGWFGGLAFLRGSAHARTATSEGAMETLLRIALPALALPILAGGVLAEPWRSRFLDDARPAVVLFLGSATIGVGVARLAAFRGSGGFDWRGNRAWLGLIFLLVAAVSLLALPIATVVGPLVQALVSVLALPVLVLGTIAGFGQVRRWIVLAYAIFWFAFIGIISLVNNTPTPETGETPAGTVGPDTAANSDTLFAVLGVGVLVLIALGIVVLARLWSRDVLARSGDDVPEERWIDTSEPARPATSRASRRRLRERGPTTAAEAYLAALSALDRTAATRRSADESPSRHAARLRASRRGAARAIAGEAAPPFVPQLALDLLAADYELSVFGGVALTPREHRRAIDRWRRIREAG